MKDFLFVSPTKFVFGRNAEAGIGAELEELGVGRVLLVYGKNAAANGLVDRVKNALSEKGIESVELSGVVPNARLEGVYRGIALAKERKCDLILGIGGGSVIDTAKGIAAGCCYEGDVWDLYCGKGSITEALPVAAVITLAAAGSEASRVSVISKEDQQLKRAFGSDLIRPVLAVMDPTLAFTASKFMLACGAYDIVSHVFERYFSPSVDVDLTDRLCEAVMISAIHAGLQVQKDPCNYEAQATLMWAGTIAQNDFLSVGRDKDGVCHNIEHEIGGIYDVAHGAGLSAIFTAWATYVCESNLPRFVQYAERVWNCKANVEAPLETALEGIRKTTEYIRQLGLPTTLTELGLGDMPEETMREIALKATGDGTTPIGGIKKLGPDDIVSILRLAK